MAGKPNQVFQLRWMEHLWLVPQHEQQGPESYLREWELYQLLWEVTSKELIGR
jgi:hypothetical protein